MNSDKNMQIIVRLLSELASTILPVRTLLVVSTYMEERILGTITNTSIFSFVVSHQVIKVYKLHK